MGFRIESHSGNAELMGTRRLKPCALCGGKNIEPFRVDPGQISYYRCLDCAYICLNPSARLSHAEEKRRYELHNNSPDDPGYRLWLQTFLDFALNPPPASGTKVLDFGSGPVPVLAGMLKEKGYMVRLEDPFFAPAHPEGPFSLITALEVFEHLSEPALVLGDLGKRLSPGGRLCLSTEFLPDNPGDFETWPYRSDATHISFFSRKGLTEAAARFGLMEDGGDTRRYIAFRKSA